MIEGFLIRLCFTVNKQILTILVLVEQKKRVFHTALYQFLKTPAGKEIFYATFSILNLLMLNLRCAYSLVTVNVFTF